MHLGTIISYTQGGVFVTASLLMADCVHAILAPLAGDTGERSWGPYTQVHRITPAVLYIGTIYRDIDSLKLGFLPPVQKV